MKSHQRSLPLHLHDVRRRPAIALLAKLLLVAFIALGWHSPLSAQSGGAYLGEDYFTYDELVAMAANSPAEGEMAPLSSFISPVIVWTPDTPLLFGVPLTAADHLNARAYDPADLDGMGQPLPGASALPGTFVYNPEAGTVLAAGPHSLSLVFAPENFGKYAVVTANRTVFVERMVPEFDWTPSTTTLTYGEPTYRSLYDATVARPAYLGGGVFLIPDEGTLSFDIPMGTLLPAGEHPVTVTFTPVNQADIQTVTQTILFTVNPYPTDLSWAAPSDEIYEFELALGVSPLNASASYRLYSLDVNGDLDAGVITPVDGSFAYYEGMIAPGNLLSNGQRLNAGSYTLLVDFTPVDNANFTSAQDTTGVAFNILPKDVAITFSLPADFLTTDGPIDVSVYASTDANPRAANGDDVPLPLVFSISSGGAWAQITPEGMLTFSGWPADGDLTKTFTVQVDFAGSANYNAATASDTASLAKVDPGAGFAAVPTDLQWQCDSLTYDLSNLDINGFNPDWSVVSGPATLLGSVLTFTGAGDVVVGWDVAETNLYYGDSGNLPTIVVAKGDPLVSWAGAVDVITYGDDLSAVLVAGAFCPDTPDSLPGVIVYTSGGQTLTATDQLDAGSYTITATFTPDAGDDWNTASADFELTVDPFPLELTIVSVPAALTWYRYEGLSVEESLPLPVAFEVTSNDPMGSAQLEYTVVSGVGSVDPATQIFSFGPGATPGTFTIQVGANPSDSNFIAAAPVMVQFEVLKSRPLLLGGTGASPLVYGSPIQQWFVEAFEARELIAVRELDVDGNEISREFFARKSVDFNHEDFKVLLPVDLNLWNLGDENAIDFSAVGVDTDDVEPFWVEYASFPLSRQYLQASAARNFTVILIAEKFAYFLSVSRLGTVTVEKAQPSLDWQPAATLVYEDLLGSLFAEAPQVSFGWTDYTGIFPNPFNERTLTITAPNTTPAVFGPMGSLTFNVLDDMDQPIAGLQGLSEADFAATLLPVGDYTVEVFFDAGPVEIPRSVFSTSEVILFNPDNFEQASATVAFSVVKRTPVATVDPLPDLWTTSAPIDLLDYVDVDALPGSGLAFTFSVTSGAEFVDLSGSILSPVGWLGDAPLARAITVQVDVAGDANYNDALPVTDTFSLSKVRQDVAFSVPGVDTVFGCGASPIQVSAASQQLDGPLSGQPGTSPAIDIAAGSPIDVVSVSPVMGPVPANAVDLDVLNAGATSLSAAAPGDLLFVSAAAAIPVEVAPYQIAGADLVWNPSDLVYPEALNASGDQFNAELPSGSCGVIAGAFTYSPTGGVVYPAGPLELTAIFTPADTRNYSGLSIVRTIEVEKGTPILDWTPAVTDLIYLETLDFSGANAASADVPGSFSYLFEDGSDAQGALLPVGAYEVFAHFVPDDEDNYNTAVIGPIIVNVDPRCFHIEFDEAIDGTVFDPAVGQVFPLNARVFYIDPQGNRVEPGGFVVTFAVTQGANLATIVFEDEDGEVTVDPLGEHVLFFQRGTVGVTASAMAVDPADQANFTFCPDVDFPAIWTVFVNKIPVTITWDWRGEGTVDDIICVLDPLTSRELNAVATALNQLGQREVVPGSYVYLPDVGAFFSTLGEATVELNFIPQDIVRYAAASAQKTVRVLTCDFDSIFGDWAAATGVLPGPGGSFDPMRDSSGNGVPDVIAFAMALDPFATERQDPVISVVDGKFRITYSKALAASGIVSFTLEGSASLGGFAPINPAAITEIERTYSGGMEIVTVEIDDPSVSFLRLAIGF